MKLTNVFLVLLILGMSARFRNSEHGKQLWNRGVSELEQHVPILEQSVSDPEQNGEALFQSEQLCLLRYAARYKGRDTETFFDSLFAVSSRLSFRPVWVLKTMFHESGLDPKARNSIGASGLIQFMPETAVSLGTNTAHIRSVSGTEQLFWIEKFWQPAKGKVHCYEDLRLYNLFPAALGQPDGFILQTTKLPARAVALRNPAFDTDGDMKITVKEFKRVVSHE